MKIINLKRIYFPVLWICILGFIITYNTTTAQQGLSPEQKLKLAQNLEKQGQYEKALEIYKGLHNNQPNVPAFAQFYARMLELLKKYEEWITLLNTRLEQEPNNPSIMSEQARAFYLWGREKEARELWEQVIQLAPENPNNYRVVSNYQQRSRLYDDATQTLLRGRERLNNLTLFANELANIYQYRRNYGLAAAEWLNWVSANPRHFAMVERVINSYPSDSDVVAEVTGSLEKVVGNSPQNINFKRMLAGFYIKNREYDNAFENYKIIDTALNAAGVQLLAYADQIFLIGQFDHAIKAYTYIVDRFPGTPNSGRMRLGLARSLDKSGFERNIAENDSVGTVRQKDHRRRALEEYNTVTKLYENTPWGVEAHFRIGDIHFNFLFDIDSAIKDYNTVRRLAPQSQWAWRATLRIGDCYVAKGNISQSAPFYSSLQTAGKPFVNLAVEADYKLLLNEYYAGNFDSLRVRLEKAIQEMPKNADICNDFIVLLLFREENLTGDPQPVNMVAVSEFVIRERKLHRKMGYYDKAVETFEKLESLYPFSQHAEQGLIAIGEIYEEEFRDYQRAINIYDDFLKNFGTSIHTDMVRSRLRRLQKQLDR